MKFTILIFIALVCAQCESQQSGGIWDSITDFFGIREKPLCERDPAPILRLAIDDFTVRLTKRAAFYANNGNYVISPYTIWLTMAAFTEFSDEELHAEFFKALSLPEDKCLRNRLYEFALTLENDPIFQRKRAFALDDQIQPTDIWLNFKQYSGLEYIPMAYDEENFDSVRQAMGIVEPLSFSGNSILLDRLNYEGSWTTAFSTGTVEPGPFYNDLGEQIGTIDYMKMKTRVRLAHIPFIDAKVLELPVGADEKYSMIFTMGVKSNTVKTILDLLRSSIIVDIIKALTVSLVPIEVAIPKFFLHHGFSAKPALEDLGFTKMFADSATRYISEPPPEISHYLQSVNVNITHSYHKIETARGNAVTDFFSDAASRVVAAFGRDFLANRPFFFTLIERKTGITIFTGLYAYPQEQGFIGSWRAK